MSGAGLPVADRAEADADRCGRSGVAVTAMRAVRAVRAPQGLAKTSLGVGSLWSIAVGASSPMVVVAGGIVATYATGVVGVALSFVVIAVALVPLTVAYVAASRHICHAAPAYALVARGLGRVWGVAGAGVALLSYTCIGVSLYGLLGVMLDGMFGLAWWGWAGLAWLVVAWLGVRHVRLGARLLAGVLVCQLVMIAGFDWVALTHPSAGSLALAGWNPEALFVDGVGGVFALGVAAFVGFESGPTYAEEAKTSAAVGRATLVALGFLGGFYAVSAWAMLVAVGPGNVAGLAADPGSGLPFGWLAESVGGWVGWLAQALLVVGILVALVSFHNVVARYVFALARERVLFAAWAKIRAGAGGGAPVAGSLVQSVTAVLVVGVVAGTGGDPLVMFTVLSTVAAIGVVTLLTACSWAAGRYFRWGGGTNEGVWTRTVAPRLGVLAGLGVLAVMVANLDTLVAVAPGSRLTWAIPGVIVASAVLGGWWGVRLRRRRRDVYDAIGWGRPHPLAVLDHGMAGLDI